MRRWGVLAVLIALAIPALGGCGEEDTRYGDEKIVDLLNLERTDGDFAIDGDPFCEISERLLNDADEVQDAADEDELGLVIASREGNVGVKGVAPFASDCAQQAKKKLNRLDPVPKEN